MEAALLSDVFRRADPHHAIRAISAAGFREIELNACCDWDPHLNLDAPAWRREAAAMERTGRAAGVRVAAVACYPNLAATDGEERARAVAYCRRGMEACAEFGARLITVMPGGNNLTPPAGQVAALRRSLAAVCDTACARDVDVAIESYPGNCVEGTDAVLALIRETGCPRLGYLLCTAHLAARGEDLVAAYAASRDVLRHIHLSDTRTSTPQHQHLVPGLGDVAFHGLAHHLQAEGYAGSISLQIYSHASEPEEACVRALAAFRELWSMEHVS